MKFATYNIACAANGYHGRGLKGIGRWIRNEGIDICVLQEVDRFARASQYLDFPAELEQQTGLHAYFAPSFTEAPHAPGLPPREYGCCILSRYKLLETHSFSLSDPAMPPRDNSWDGETRGALLVRVEIEGRDVWALGTHLGYTPGYQPSAGIEQQVKNLIAHVNRIVPADAPLILGGDLNNDDAAPDFAPLRAAFTCATANIPGTWPLDFRDPGKPQERALDHIYLRGASARDVKVHIEEELSDHAAVSAVISFAPKP